MQTVFIGGDTMAECFAHDGATPACPPLFLTRVRLPDRPLHFNPYNPAPPPPGKTTACCPPMPSRAPVTSTSSPTAAPSPPQVCPHTGVTECDVYLTALQEHWKQGGPWEIMRPVLDQGCDAWAAWIKANDVEWIRDTCVTFVDMMERSASSP